MDEQTQLPSELLKEFLKTTILINVLETSHINGDYIEYLHHGNYADPLLNSEYLEYDFTLTWNDLPSVYQYDSYKERQDYKEFLEKKEAEFRSSVSLIPRLNIPSEVKFEHLIDFSHDLFQAINSLYVEKFDYCGFHHDFLTSKNLRIYYSSKNKISEIAKCRIIHSYIIYKKEFLIGLKNYVEKYLDVFKEVGFESSQQRTIKTMNIPFRKNQERNSFILINPEYFASGAFKNFKESLEEQEFIESISLIIFKKVFQNEKLEKKVDWIADKNTLFYFIKRLHKLDKIEKHNPFWQIVSNCFTWKGSQIESEDISRCHSPADQIIKNRIDRAINFLR